MTKLDWTTLATVLVTQGVTLVGAIYGYRKDNGQQHDTAELTNRNYTLEQDLRRLCGAILDDVPYEKLKDIAHDVQEDFR